jgi:GDP-4-dehydro-6-deoxy-D-mannose reductase
VSDRRAPRRVLITGACGFVGRWLIAELRRRLPEGSAIIAGVHASDAIGADVSRRLDVRDRDAVHALVEEARPTAVVHLAAVSSPPAARSNPRVTWDINVIGTMNLADAVLARAPRARFIFIGSSECYGGSFNKVTGAVNEDVLLDPANPYAATKAAADLLIGQMARDGLRAVRFRPFNHTGPGQTDAFVVPAFAAQIAAIEQGRQEPALKVGNLDALRDFSDVRDIVSAYADAILRDEDPPAGVILNLASGKPLRIGQILDDLIAMAKVAIRVESDPARMRANDTPSAIGDATRARQLLGWAPRIDFSQTLRDVLDFHRARAS